MLYFKLPFDEKIYSTDENSENQNIQFHSFDQKEQVSFRGKIIEIDSENFENIRFFMEGEFCHFPRIFFFRFRIKFNQRF